jgi:hypothetical protein
VVDGLDLCRTGIATVLWATGYRLDYRWMDLPIFDEFGYPSQRRGVTEVPGLYFVGLLWQHNQLSATLLGASLDSQRSMALQPKGRSKNRVASDPGSMTIASAGNQRSLMPDPGCPVGHAPCR